MAAKFSDEEIASLLCEQKPLPPDYRSLIQLRDKRGHKERELDLKGVNGTEFRLILRQSDFNALDFSVILAVCPPDTNQVYRLRRYNGKSHEHTNNIEGNSFYDFHMHTATVRYQELGMQEDTYAEVKDSFSDFHSALERMLADCGFDMPEDRQFLLEGM